MGWSTRLVSTHSLDKKARKKRATAAHHLTYYIEQKSVCQREGEGINFSTKANRKEKSEEKVGVIVKLVEFPFVIYLSEDRQNRIEKTYQPARNIYPHCLSKTALLIDLYRSLPH